MFKRYFLSGVIGAALVGLVLSVPAQARDNSLFMGTAGDHGQVAPAAAGAVAVDGVRLPGFTITHDRLISAKEIVWLP